jgi:Spy/CpxP family protein refolding chaperone
MKRYIIWSSVVLALLLVVTGIAVARAAGAGRHDWCGQRWGFHGPLGSFNHKLNLSDAQKLQIKTMWQADRPVVAALVRDLALEAKEMDSATEHGSLDESKAQIIAAHQGETIAKLLVEKQRFTSKVYSVLNSEQRSKADELLKKWESGLDYVADRLEIQPAKNRTFREKMRCLFTAMPDLLFSSLPSSTSLRFSPVDRR